MSCFSRFFHRYKNTFDPAEDENKDTILNYNDSPVQIGRYIKREETSLFAPVPNENKTQLTEQQNQQNLQNNVQVQNEQHHNQYQTPQQQQQQTQQQQDQLEHLGQQQQQFLHNKAISNNATIGTPPTPAKAATIIEKHNSNNNLNNVYLGNDNSKNNNSNINSNGNSVNVCPSASANASASTNDSFSNDTRTIVNTDNNLNKKFISNKNKFQSNNSNSNSNNNINNIGITNNGSFSHNQKLKPVKERRPTALPTEAPHLNHDDDNDDDNGNVDDKVDIDTNDFNGSAGDAGNVSDMIKQKNENKSNNEATDDLDSVLVLTKSQTLDNGFSESFSLPRTPSSTNNVQFFIGNRHSDEDDDEHLNLNLKYHVEKENFTASEFVTKPLTANRKPSSLADLPSNSNGSRPKFRRGSSQVVESIHIPPPPPLPLKPLVTPSPTLSLISHKSNKCSCNSFRKLSTTHECNFFINQSEETGTNPYTKERTSTPTDSDSGDSIKSHRTEGGLIFARPNLPEKKNVEIVVIEKDEETRNIIRMAIERNDFLNNYMDKERKEMVIDAMSPISFEKDSIIIHENDEGSEIFVAEEGFFDVIKSGKIVGSISPMNVFGELAILYNAKRQATIKASTNAKLWKIEREKFREIMKISGSKERQENLNFLKTAPFLNDLSEEVLSKVVDLLRKKFFETNTCIVREGEVGNEFFIIRGGTVTIKKKNEENVEKVVDRRKRGDYFGEQALLNADRRQASVYADAPGTEVLILEREAFISYLGTIPQLHELPVKRDSVKEQGNNRKKSEFDNEFADVQLSELKKVATLGAGAFGRVDLVSYKNKTFALKIIKKIDVVKQDQVEHVYNEKKVMIKCHSSPFIIELYKTFRNEKFVYFLMEACLGGDVWTVMSQRKCFDEKTARFIAGCVVEAFDFLHSMNIIYRDLKPENLMLTTDGYCKLVDFGFAKQIPTNQKTNTFAGTPEYVAPEIILDRGHDRSVDYWALGILIFELLVGKTPFRGQTQIKIYQQILGGIDVIQMPARISKTAQNLIKSLCKQLPAERLGYQRRGILDIKKHSWFESMDWNKLRNKQIASPITRPITSSTDTQYFVPTGVENENEPPDEMSGWDIDF